MLNYINLSFDYESVYEKDGHPEISNDVVSTRGTGRLEFLDDSFFHSQGSCVTVIAGSQKDTSSIFIGKGQFSVQRTEGLEQQFYRDFSKAKTGDECQMIWETYNNKLFEFSLLCLKRLQEYREIMGLAPITYDFIHTPTSWLTLGAAKRLSEYLHIPLVSTIHVNEEEIQHLKGNLRPRSDFILEKDMSTKKESDIVLVKNHALYTQVSKLNNHCVEVHNDLSFNPYEDGILRRKNPKKILYVGRISYEKGFDRLTQFIQKINSSKNDYEFVVCGEIFGNKEIMKDIDLLQTYPNVYFEGQVGRTSIQDVFLDCGIFILPSRTEIYNQAIMEAAYYGCNIICTDVGAAKDQLKDFPGCHILPNDETFADSALEILHHTEWTYEQSVNIHHYADQKFNKNRSRIYKMSILQKLIHT